MKIAFALLAHQHPQIVARLVRNIVDAGFTVAIHYDLKAPPAQYQFLVDAFGQCPAVRITRRIDVRWGMWSVVEATLICLDEIHAAGWEPDYVYHASGSDYPIRSSRELVEFLVRHNGQEFIESVSANNSRWVKGGPQQERYQFRFLFNWRQQKLLFDLSLLIQKKFFRPRTFVRNMEPFIGSQWWTLTWRTLQKVRELAREPDVRNFFRTTLIPDELFFQTLVRHLVPEPAVVPRALTLNHLTDYGIPTVFYADHAAHLVKQPFFLARKISPYHTGIHEVLDSYWRGERIAEPKCDSEYGCMSPEYESHRLAYRHGPPGKPLVGHRPDRRLGGLGRLDSPYFVVIGTSTMQLRLIHCAMLQNSNILFHRQLFHSARIEFAPGIGSFAGFRTSDVAMRSISPADFLADVVRCERQRLTGFLLRWGQGGRIAEVMFERPNVRIVVARGDLLLSFVENVLRIEPALDEAVDGLALNNIAADFLVDRFRGFADEFVRHRDWLAKQVQLAATVKAPGSIAVIEADIWSSPAASGLNGPLSTGLAMDCHWTDLRSSVTAPEVPATLARCKRIRELAVERLKSAGIAADMIDGMRLKSEAWPEP